MTAMIASAVTALGPELSYSISHQQQQQQQQQQLTHRRGRDAKDKVDSKDDKSPRIDPSIPPAESKDWSSSTTALNNSPDLKDHRKHMVSVTQRVPSIKRKKNLAIPTAHIRPGHTTNSESVLTRDRHSGTPAPSYSGFAHLAVIILLVAEVRLLIQDYNRDGVIMTLFRMGISRKDVKTFLLLLATAPAHLLVALTIERAAARTIQQENQRALENKQQKSEITSASENGSTHKSINDPTAPKYLWSLYAALHILNSMLALCITSSTVYWHIHHPFIGTISECNALILCLKISSYALVNRDLRYLIGSPHVPDMYHSNPYPGNLTVGNLIYFWWAPTLMYQPAYPRTDRIRWKFVLTCFLEMVGSGVLSWFLAGQYAIPTLRSSLPYFQSGDAYGILECLLRLSGVSIVIWLLGFYFIFQGYLNFVGELLRFGDRDFYQDWWNSGSVGTYWRLWNRPVTLYFKRHVYVPMLKRGYSPFVCSSFVFLLSAVLHEMLVGIPTRQIIGVAFACMLSQIPLVIITAPLEHMRGPGTTIGNCVFWLSLFFGQPFAVLIYYYAWNVKYGELRETY